MRRMILMIFFFFLAITVVILCSASQVAVAQPVIVPAPVTDDMKAKAKLIADRLLNAPSRATEVYDRLAVLVDDFGPRFSGSDSLEAALDWIVATAQKDVGYTVTTEPVMVPRWVRGEESAFLHTATQPNQKLAWVGLGMSNGTSGVPITAPVLVVHNKSELDAQCSMAAGKIVVWNWFTKWPGYDTTYRYNSGAWSAACGAVASIIRTVSSFGMQTPHTGGTRTASGNSIPTGALSLADTDQIQRQWDRRIPMNITLTMNAHFEPDRQSRNIIFELKGDAGSGVNDEYVHIGGHIDSWDIARGAMDDGGGVVTAWVAVKALAELVASKQISLKRTIRAVMWVNEENGNRGGEAYARDNAAILSKSSIAIECDEGSFEPFSLGFSGSAAAEEQLRVLAASSMFDAIRGPGGISVAHGGGGEDISPMCSEGVPCAGVLVLDPRATADANNNPCLEWQTPQDFDAKRVSALATAGISSGYFWYHHSVADDMRVVSARQLQQVAAFFAVWAMSISELPNLLPRTGIPPATTTTTTSTAVTNDPAATTTTSGAATAGPSSSAGSTDSSQPAVTAAGFFAGLATGVALCLIGTAAYCFVTRRRMRHATDSEYDSMAH